MSRSQGIPQSIHDGDWTRRDWLFGGAGLGGTALGLRGLSAGQPVTSSGAALGRAKSVIVMFLGGGPPQHETWDPKPQASEEVRGAFGAIASKTPGLFVGELMPRTAQLTDKIAVLRAMVTNDNAHSSSGYQMMTGVPHIALNEESAISKPPNLSPHWGAMAKYVDQQFGALPQAITLPNRIANMGVIPWPGQTGGVLGPQYDP